MRSSSFMEIETFIVVARHRGFRSAAREMETSPSVVSHAIASLEERLGVRLFNRTTRSVALTEAGEQYLHDVGPAIDAIHGAGSRLQDQGTAPSGTLRLNMFILPARMLLQPIVMEYLARHPRVDVEIVTEGALVDIVGKGFDAGVRIREAVPDDMIVVPLTDEMRGVVVGAPAYFKRFPVPKVPHDLRDHQCIRTRMANGRIYKWEFEKRGEIVNLDVPGRLTLDEGGLVARAAMNGAGLAQLPEDWVADDIAAGRLVKVLADWTPPYPGLCLYYPSRRHMPAKLRAFIDVVRDLRASRA
jgi:DNA-binding transcriptional LysR family regulator